MMTHAPTLRLYTEWNELAGTRPGDRYLIANPFFHIFGYKAGCIASMIRGMTILPVPVFDIGHVLDLVEREKVTVLPGPPMVYHELLKAHREGGRDLSTLRVAVTGAADIPVELIRQIRQDLPFTSIMTGYGLARAPGRRAGGRDRGPRRAPRPGRQGVRGPQARPGQTNRAGAHHLGQNHDGRLQSAKIRRIPPRAPAERHRKSHEGPAQVTGQLLILTPYAQDESIWDN
jgi:acyl-CoA synthetase (AMP-forming)/AMP-acid ligase II